MMGLLPGILLALVIGILASVLASVIPLDFMSAAVLAIFLGLLTNHFFNLPESVKPGVKFSAKRLLKGFIILLGASMNLNLIIEIGGQSLILLVFTISTAFITSFLIGKLLKTGSRLSKLFAAGGAICGGTAITALSTVIDAKEEELAYSVSTVFLIDMFLILLVPLTSHTLNISDIAVGFWSGTAINDTSSVVAASFSFSQVAGEIATMVKMTRTLAIIPVILIFSYLSSNDKSQTPSIQSIFPWFIVGFAGLAIINTLGWIPESINGLVSLLRQILMVTALAAIGLKTDIESIKLLGLKPFVHSLIVSIALLVVSLTVINFII